ncbi:ATP-binding protein [Arcobacter sp. YIC-80]|uniref:sensor histidine kinase n=1 Tax=Arcobacter sp. YIC-80 TaxID=3376683 RepID=UPI00384D7EDB
MNDNIDLNLDKKANKYNKYLYSVFLIILILVFTSTYIDLQSKKSNIENHLKATEENIIQEYKQRLKESIHTTIYFIDKIHRFYIKKQKQTGKNFEFLTKSNYKLFENEVREYLYNSIFEKQRYTWINKIENINDKEKYAKRLIHPNLKNTEGIYLSLSTKDIKGNLPYKEELEGILKNNEVFYSYYFKEFTSQKITKKISYAKLYKKYNWIIATGIPLNILDDKINNLNSELIKEYDNYLIKTISIKVFILLVILFVVYYLKNNTRKYLFKSLEKSYNNLKETTLKLSEATKSAQIGIWKWDITKDILDWDEEMYKLYEVEKKDGKSDYQLWASALYEDDMQEAQSKLQESINKRIKFEATFRIKTKKGLKYIKASGKVVYDENDKPLFMIGANYDITNLKEFEKQQLQLLEQAKMASLGEMIGNIAHQWRQPLSLIRTACTGIKFQNEIGVLTDKLLLEELESIDKSTMYLSETIDTFRNFIKEEKEYKSVILQDRIKETINLLNATLKNNYINLKTNIEQIEPIEIKIIADELSQVIINIINNAKDVFKEREVQDPKIILNLYKEDNRVILTIEDNAGGVPSKVINHIFEPYFTTKHQSQGTGLGLYMSHKIVTESLKGKLFVENTKDGAKFFIELPL